LTCRSLCCPALLATVALAASAEERPPEALRKLIEHRKALRAADVHWSVRRAGGALADIEIFHRTRLAPSGDHIDEDLGDHQGRQPIREDGKLRYLPEAGRSFLTLGSGGAYDLAHHHDSVVELSDPEAKAAFQHPLRGDVRTLGMGLRYRFEVTPETAIWAGVDQGFTGPVTRYSQRREGAVEVVEAEFESRQRVIWEIDPGRGWNARRIYFVHTDGSIPMETSVTLQKFGAVWFPASVEHRSQGEVTSDLQVYEARFGDGMPRELGLKDLGVEPGMTVVRRGQSPSFAPVWDGAKAIPRHEWEELLRRGEREEGPKVRRYRESLEKDDGQDIPVEVLRRAYTLKGALDIPLSSWRQYADRVIWSYQYDEEQKQKSLLVLAEVEQEARRQAEALKPDFEALEKRLAEAKRSLTGPEADATWEKLDFDVRAALGFLQTLFDDQLVPRLHAIATRAQRSAAVKQQRIPIAWP
jgi:hypothetical protein